MHRSEQWKDRVMRTDDDRVNKNVPVMLDKTLTTGEFVCGSRSDGRASQTGFIGEDAAGNTLLHCDEHVAADCTAGNRWRKRC